MHRKILIAAGIFALCTTTVTAKDGHQRNDRANDAPDTAGTLPDQNMQTHILKMKTLMEKIRQAETFQERQQLMQAHMAEMQKAMAILEQPPAARDEIRTSAQLLERLTMMEAVMAQLMEHMLAQEHHDADHHR